MCILALREDILIINQSYSSAINNQGPERCSGRYWECKYLAVIVINERAVWLKWGSKKNTWEELTCADNPLNLNARCIQLLGKLMDSPVWILVGFRVNIGFCAWKFNCRRVRELLLRLNMHAAHKEKALDGRMRLLEGRHKVCELNSPMRWKIACQKVSFIK